MNKKVSIIIPVYNEEKYIERCINSIEFQTYKNYELILIDDGSTDKTYDIIKKCIKENNKIILIKQNHGGPGKARNLGVKVSTGNILIFVDADMMFDRYYIEKLIKPIIDKKAIGTIHGTELVSNINNIWAKCWSVNRIPSHVKYGGVFRAIKKKDFLKVGGFDNSKGYFDDDLHKIGKSLYVDEAICYHNNPETLKEAFNHCIWVGSSFNNKKIIIEYIKKYMIFMLVK
jgi:glycosyltransferase involved in cell wall biosynthesis